MLAMAAWVRPATAALEVEAESSQVAILHSYHPGFPWTDGLMQGILETFGRVDPQFQPFVEYLDCKHFPDSRHTEQLAAFYRQKYADRRIDIVITTDNPALEFALHYRNDLFKGIPIVFCGVNGFTPEMLAGQSEITGVAEVMDMAATVQIALTLHPNTREIVVLHDYTVTGLSTRRELEAVIPQFKDQVSFRFLDDLPMEEILKQVADLPADRLVLLLSFVTDRDKRVFPQQVSTQWVARRCPVPVYGVHRLRLGSGIVGGSLLDAGLHGQRAAEIALRVLAGEQASRIPVDVSATSRFMFDHTQLERFGIDKSALPPGSEIINAPESFYHKYRHIVVFVAAVIVVLSIIICLLLLYILARRRAERNRRELIRQLESKNSELERFAYTVSHDLRSPLVTIMGFVGMLERDAVDGQADALKADIRFISDAARRMDQLLRELLDFSRIGRVVNPPAMVPLGEVAREAASLVTGRIAERGVQLKISDDLPTIRGDRQRLLEVFQNLIENAVKFMGSQPDPLVEIGIRRQGDQQVCYVRDNGEGLDPRHTEKVFRLFERLDTETEGTGVGLAIVQRIVELHGGHVWIETAGVGKGCTVCFTLAGSSQPATTPAG